MPWYPQRRRRTTSSNDADDADRKQESVQHSDARRPRCSLPGPPRSESERSGRRVDDSVARRSRGSWACEENWGSGLLMNSQQPPKPRRKTSADIRRHHHHTPSKAPLEDGTAARRDMYGQGSTSTTPVHTPMRTEQRGLDGKSRAELLQLHAKRVANEPIYDVIDIGDDANTFSPNITPWNEHDDDDDVVRVEVGAGPALARMSSSSSLRSRSSKKSLSSKSPTIAQQPRSTAGFAIDHPQQARVQRVALKRVESSVELGIICCATGETKKWERIQRIRVPPVSVQDAEALLLQHERGPGTFLFREHDGNVVLTLWDGTSVHHLDVRDHDDQITPTEFQGQRFRDFVRCFRGGASGSLPSALRYLVLVDPETPSPPRDSAFTVHTMYPQPTSMVASTPHKVATPLKTATPKDQYGVRTPQSLGPPRQLMYDRVLDHATKTRL